MASDEQFIHGTVNEALGKGKERLWAELKSAGFNPIGSSDPHAAKDPRNYNGGIYGKRVGRIEKGDLLFRFSDSKTAFTLEDKFRGYWWFDLECLKTMRQVARMGNSGFTETARTYLAVLYEWGDMKNLVGGKVMGDYWCFKGLSGGISGAQQQQSGPFRTDVMQLYVPGGLKLGDFVQPHDNVLTSGIV